MAALPFSAIASGDSAITVSTPVAGTRLTNIPAPTQVNVSVGLALPTPVSVPPPPSTRPAAYFAPVLGRAVFSRV
jgi:hypothetical protein